ncbi:PilZ domain-containing protein [Paraliomyxa miuraensis]|uniref:PilZ domain-containing protein n=1 Tax=Paraliomyxa miuraensis TaxID=376150 RepID=UPI0022507B33|nr:PilZ domain-containing protein [Paraliomyxa miuraensis]MCX4248006.1 PilZ domain-containing protein [Paraliomyxa miuraensis]
MASNGDKASERRRAERVPINTEFAAMPSATYISDLSEYGVFVHTSAPSPLGSTIKLCFTVLLDDPVIVEAEGRVVRHQYEPAVGMGIEFTDLSPDMIERINAVMERQQPVDSGPPLPKAEGLDLLGFDSDDGEPDAIDAVADPMDAAQTLDRGRVPAESPASSGRFRPPPLPGPGLMRSSDEDAKTGLYQPVEDPIEDLE